MSYYAHLDALKVELDALIAASKFPDMKIEVMPAAPQLEDIARISRNARFYVALSIAALDDEDEAAGAAAEGSLTCVAHIYTHDGTTSKHGEVIERNRLAAMAAEQLHVYLRDPYQYQVEGASRTYAMGRGTKIKARNWSFRRQGGGKSPDEYHLAHWVVEWQAAVMSEPMNPDTLADLTRIDITFDGDELGGNNPDDDDNEETRVTFS